MLSTLEFIKACTHTVLSRAADGSAAMSALPNGASAVNGGTQEQEKAGAQVALEDLFKDVWMAEDEEAEPEVATQSSHVPDTEVSHHSSLSALCNTEAKCCSTDLQDSVSAVHVM